MQVVRGSGPGQRVSERWSQGADDASLGCSSAEHRGAVSAKQLLQWLFVVEARQIRTLEAGAWPPGKRSARKGSLAMSISPKSIKQQLTIEVVLTSLNGSMTVASTSCRMGSSTVDQHVADRGAISSHEHRSPRKKIQIGEELSA